MEQQTIDYNNCKICGGETAEFLNQFELLQCSRCHFIFYRHRLDDRDALQLYDELYNEREDYLYFKKQAIGLKNGSQPRLGYNKRKVLQPLLRKRCGKFIEIGAGVGIAGAYLQKKNKQYQGIELDKQAAALANDAGVNVESGSFECLSSFQNEDAVIAFEVLEHIDNIKHCFELMHGSLRPGGYIGFTVPNFERFHNLGEKQKLKSLGQDRPPVHINFFTTTSLKKILPLFGFKPLYLRARRFPNMDLKSSGTYQKLWRSLKGQYHGTTIMCVAQKNLH